MFRFCDSFDHYDTGGIHQKWTAIINSGAAITDGVSNAGAVGRNGQGLFLPRSGIGIMPGVSKTLDYQNQWTVGFAYYNNNGVGTPGGGLYALYNNALQVCSLTQENDGTLTMRAGGIPMGNISGYPLSGGTWYYIEIQSNPGVMNSGDPSATHVVGYATMSVKINGNPAGNATQNFYYNAYSLYQPGANRHDFFGAGNLASIIDDLYIVDNVQPGIVTFMGDVRIGCIYPRSDVVQNFNPVGDHFSLVNEHLPDDDTTYVYSNSPGQADTYYFDNVTSFVGTIPAVHLNIYARKDDEGYRAFKSIGVAQNSINGNRYVNDSYVYYSFPDDKGWTPSSVNATAFGMQIVDVS